MPSDFEPISLASPAFDAWILRADGRPFSGYSTERKNDVDYVLDSVLGVGGKGVVFAAHEKDTATKVVLKFPTLDFTYLDPAISASSRLEHLRTLFAEREQEYVQEYERSLVLLKGCDVANKTTDLISQLYQFKTPGARVSEQIPLRVGVQDVLENNTWSPLDESLLQHVWSVELATDNLPKQPPISYPEWLEYALQIGRAVHEVHDRRVIHGDIWAPNVFISRTVKPGALTIKLIDFGNSWSTEFVSAQLGGGRLDSYAPPEERRSLLPKSQASDVFGYGVLLLWLLTGPNTGDRSNELKGYRTHLLLAYLRRKSVDKKIRDLFKDCPRGFLTSDLSNKLVNGLIDQQDEALNTAIDLGLLRDVAKPWEGIQNRSAEDMFARIKADETFLEDHLKSLLKTEYDSKEQAGRKPSQTVSESVDSWRNYDLLKRRLFRPCESMVYDPGEVTIEHAASQRKEIRRRILGSEHGKAIFLENPWIVDVIAHCMLSDQARRPRMSDVLRDIETHSAKSDNKGRSEDPLQTILAHRRKILEIPADTKFENLSKSGHKTEIDLKESRDLLIEYMSVSLGSLAEGDTYSSVTTCDMWHANALGHDGRFLTANWEALKKGASIRRIFVMSLEELGTRYFVQMVVALAKSLKIFDEDESTNRVKLLRRLEDRSEPDDIENFLPADPSKHEPAFINKRIAFACLFHQLRIALHKQLKDDLKQQPHDEWRDGEYVRQTFEQRYDARSRFKKILESYYLFRKPLGANRSDDVARNSVVIWSEQLPRAERTVEQLEAASQYESGIFGLFLGLCIEPLISSAVRLRSLCPRAIIQTRSPMQTPFGMSKYVVLETEARGRSRDQLLALPELNRLRVYYSSYEQGNEKKISPTVRAFRRIMHGVHIGKPVSPSKPNGPIRTIPVVNLGCLLEELLTVVFMMNFKAE